MNEGIKEVKDALAMVFAFGKIFKQAKENDGVINAADLSLMVGAIPSMGPAFEGIDKIPAELKDLDMEEVKELLIYSSAHLGGHFESEELKEKVEKGLAAVVAMLEFYKAMK